MCLVITLWRPQEEYPLILAANRDESYDRPGEPPKLLSAFPRVWGGRDPEAGGTWLGLNEHGLLVALTDGPADEADRTRRSRGLLCLDALAQSSATNLQDWLARETDRHPYNPFNLFWSDGKECSAAYWHQARLRAEVVPPGLHHLANTPRLDDRDVPKIRYCQDQLQEIEDAPLEGILLRLAELCASHGGSDPEAVCIHEEKVGTLSSSILALHGSELARCRYLHAESHPCRSNYEDLSHLLAL